MSGRNLWIVGGLVALLAVGGSLAVLSREGAAPEGPRLPRDQVALLRHFLVELPKQPVRAENFTAHPIGDAAPSLSAYAGKFVLLNFWATWCGPCKTEMPELEALYRATKERGVVVLAVSMAEAPEKVAEFIRGTDYTFPVLADPDSVVAELYGVSSIPLTYLIDPDGWIVGRALGPRQWNAPALRDFFLGAAGNPQAR